MTRRLLVLGLTAAVAVAATDISISTGWRLASSAQLPAGTTGADISNCSFDTSGWLELGNFPTTVLGALASNGSAPNPDFMLPLYFGRNLNETDASLFDVPWWYRAPLPSSASTVVQAGGRALLTFKGVNYRANVWVNGRLVAANNTIEGAFQYHDVDVTAALAAGTELDVAPAVAVQVFRSFDWGLDCEHPTTPKNNQVSCRGKTKAEAQDLAITFVDWAPAAPDANMGLWREVSLGLMNEAAAAVTVRYPQISTKLSNSNKQAEMEVIAEP